MASSPITGCRWALAQRERAEQREAQSLRADAGQFTEGGRTEGIPRRYQLVLSFPLFSLCTLLSSHLLEHMAPLPGMRFAQDDETFYHRDTNRRQLFPVNQVWEVLRFLFTGVQRLNRQNGTFRGLPPRGGGCQQIISTFEILLITRLIIQSIPQTLLLKMSTLTFSIYYHPESFHFKSF